MPRPAYAAGDGRSPVDHQALAECEKEEGTHARLQTGGGAGPVQPQQREVGPQSVLRTKARAAPVERSAAGVRELPPPPTYAPSVTLRACRSSEGETMTRLPASGPRASPVIRCRIVGAGSSKQDAAGIDAGRSPAPAGRPC